MSTMCWTIDAGELDGATEDGIEHRLGQPARERVLLAGVIRTDQCRAAVDGHLDTVTESRPWTDAELIARGAISDMAQADDDSDAARRAGGSDGGELAVEEGPASVDLGGCRPIGRWRALHRRRDVRAGERQTVTDSRRRRLVGETGPMHGTKQPIAAAIAGEHAACAIGAMSCGRQPEHDDRRSVVAESRHRPAPVLLVAERGTLGGGDLFPPAHEPWTRTACDDVVEDVGENFHAEPR